MRPDFQLRDDVGIYLDNALTTVVSEDVLDEMRKYWEFQYGVPGALYELGRDAQNAIDESREAIVDVLKCKHEELFFTSGGTESNNWAIKGLRKGKKGFMIGATEHESVLKSTIWEADDNDVPNFSIPVDRNGIVDLSAMDKELKTKRYMLVSVQYANDETGVIQPVKEISELCKKHKVLYHCDAVQAFGKIGFDVDDVGADMVSFSSHKIHGPTGMGALYVKLGTPLDPLLHGGGQEYGFRSGTLAVPLIVGFAKATELAVDSIRVEMPRIRSMTDSLWDMIHSYYDDSTRNGNSSICLPNILNLTVPNIESDIVCGIMNSRYMTSISTGAGCSGMNKSSHVLEAMGLKESDVKNTLRISFSRYNDIRDVDLVFVNLQMAIRDAKIRSLV